MLVQIAYTRFFGFSVIGWFGILALVFLLMSAFVAIANQKGWAHFNFKTHRILAVIGIFLALVHGLILMYLSF